MPIVLMVCVGVTIFIAIHANRVAAERAMAEAEQAESSHLVSFEVTEAQLQKDAYPEVNEVISRYFEAYVSGDVGILNNGLYRTLDETETITVEERAKYIEDLRNLTVYTKPGPVENSWVVYAYSEVRYIGCETFLPGAVAFYVCKDENGEYYINADENAQSVKEYINAVSLQDDVVDLFNRINVEYKEELDNDPMFGELVAAIYAEIDESVKARLAALSDSAGEGGDNASGAEIAEEQVTAPKEVKIRAMTTVNVRSSDSTEASVVGKAEEGQEYVRIAEQPNGWSKISFAGSAAYVKSEYFEVVSEEPDPATEEGDTQNDTEVTGETDAESTPANGETAADGAEVSNTADDGAPSGNTAGTASSAQTSTSAAGSSNAGSGASAGTGRDSGVAVSGTGASSSAGTAASGARSSTGAGRAASTGGSTGNSDSRTGDSSSASQETGNSQITNTGVKYITGGGVRVRTEPSTEADVIVQLYDGTRITVTKIRSDGWSEVEYRGQKGYVKTEFLADGY